MKFRGNLPRCEMYMIKPLVFSPEYNLRLVQAFSFSLPNNK